MQWVAHGAQLIYLAGSCGLVTQLIFSLSFKILTIPFFVPFALQDHDGRPRKSVGGCMC